MKTKKKKKENRRCTIILYEKCILSPQKKCMHNFTLFKIILFEITFVN